MILDVIFKRPVMNLNIKLPIPDELHCLIFSFLSPKEQQNLTIVNKFWSKTVILTATNQQTEKIQKYIASINLFSKFYITSLNEKIYKAALKELDSISKCITSGCFNTTNFIKFKDSIQLTKKTLIQILAPLDNLDKIENIEIPFLFDKVITISSLYYRCELVKKMEKGYRQDCYFDDVSKKLASHGEVEGAFMVAKLINCYSVRKSNLSLIFKIFISLKQFDEAEEIADLFPRNTDEMDYELAIAAANAGDCKRALRLLQKIPFDELYDEIYIIVAKCKADKGEFDEAEEIALKIKGHSLEKTNKTLIYVLEKKSQHAVKKDTNENCAIM